MHPTGTRPIVLQHTFYMGWFSCVFFLTSKTTCNEFIFIFCFPPFAAIIYYPHTACHKSSPSAYCILEGSFPGQNPYRLQKNKPSRVRVRANVDERQPSWKGNEPITKQISCLIMVCCNKCALSSTRISSSNSRMRG